MNEMHPPSRSLSDLVEVARNVIAPEEIPEATTYVGLENISGETGEIERKEVGVGELKSAKFHFTKHHLLYGKLRPNLRKVARPAFSGICSTDILPLLPGEEVDRGFLYHWLRRPEIVAAVSAQASGVNLPRISPKHLLELRIALPSLTEQRRIAALLDRADAMRRKREESRRLVDELLQSVFLEMFGDSVRNDRGWDIRTIGEVCLVRGGKRLAKNSHYSESPTPFRYIRATDIRDGRINESGLLYLSPEVQQGIARYTVSEGDVVLTIAGTIGEIAAVPAALAGANLTENAARLTIRNRGLCDPTFLAELLRQPAVQGGLRSETGQVTIQKLALFRVERVVVPFPPIAIQRKFAACVNGIRLSANRLDRVVALSVDLCASLQSSLLATG